MPADALDKAVQVVPDETHLGAAAADCLGMAESYLDDGRYFKVSDSWMNALAPFSHGYGWLDADARMGPLDIPNDSHPSTM